MGSSETHEIILDEQESLRRNIRKPRVMNCFEFDANIYFASRLECNYCCNAPKVPLWHGGQGKSFFLMLSLLCFDVSQIGLDELGWIAFTAPELCKALDASALGDRGSRGESLRPTPTDLVGSLRGFCAAKHVTSKHNYGMRIKQNQTTKNWIHLGSMFWNCVPPAKETQRIIYIVAI